MFYRLRQKLRPNFSASDRKSSDETPSEKNQAEENLQDTTEPTTEIISADVSKAPPLTQQTHHLQTSPTDVSETNKVCLVFNNLKLIFRPR